MTEDYVKGTTVDLVAEFRDSSDNLTSVDGTPTITVTDSDGTDQVSSANMTNEATGRWVYYFDTDGTVRGMHRAVVSADVDTGSNTRTEKAEVRFRVID